MRFNITKSIHGVLLLATIILTACGGGGGGSGSAAPTNTFTDNFDGTSLQSAYWTPTGVGAITVSGGITDFSCSTSADTNGKYTFSGDSIVIEARMAGSGSSRDTAIYLHDVNNAANSIQAGDTNYGGMGLYTYGSGVFNLAQAGNGTSVSGYKEYRLTITSTSLTVERGDTLANITETWTATLGSSIAGKTFYLSIGGAGSPYCPADYDWVRVFPNSSSSPASISATANTTAQNLTVGTAMASFTPLTASGGTPPYTYSYTGTLPAGLSFNASTGAVTGTPTAAYATANLVFSVKDANNVVASIASTVSFTVGAAIPISATATTTAQNLTVGMAMSSFTPLTASGGATPYTYSYTGTLPTGLSFNASTGAVTGTPTATYATSNLIFSVRDANNNYANTTSTVSFTVSASGTTYQSAYNTCYVGTPALYSTTYCAAYANAIVARSTPAVANQAGADAACSNVGNIGLGQPIDATGTPNTSGVCGGAFSVTYNTTAQNLMFGTAMASFSPFTISGGRTPYVFSYTGTLPAGLSFNTSTGVVTGTPTAFSTFNVPSSVCFDVSGTGFASGPNCVNFYVSPWTAYQGGLTWFPVYFWDISNNASSDCSSSTFNGLTGWRLPTLAELSALYASGAMNGKGWLLGYTWTSSYNTGYPYTLPAPRYYVDLSSGYVGSTNMDINYYVACVR